MRRLPLLCHHPGSPGEAPGLRRRRPEVSDTVRPGADDPRDGSDEIGRQGISGQDIREGESEGAGLRDVTAEDAINFTLLDKIISG